MFSFPDKEKQVVRKNSAGEMPLELDPQEWTETCYVQERTEYTQEAQLYDTHGDEKLSAMCIVGGRWTRQEAELVGRRVLVPEDVEKQLSKYPRVS